MCDPVVDDLQPSLLGTREYWDQVYSTELENFLDHGDVGEVWFGEEIGRRVTRWLVCCELVSKDDPVLDLGCGNGMQLVQLAKEGFTSLTGVDYSQTAVDLARAVAQEQGAPVIRYQALDFLSDDVLPHEHFGIVLDKGTYDAVGLNPEDGPGKRARYADRARGLLRPGGLLVITSCNWTQEELLQQFDSRFKFFSTIPTQRFQFGGGAGSTATTVIFMRT